MRSLSTWPYPNIVAHRGGGNLAPENTLAAIKKGYELGHTMIEFDVTLSKDDIPFLLHDDTLNRTTNSQGTPINFTWHELSKLDAGRWFSSEFNNEPLAQLSEVADLCLSLNIQVNIEIKPPKGLEEKTGRIVARLAETLFKQSKMPPLLSSFSPEALRGAKEVAPSLPRGLLMHRFRSDWSNLVNELECYSIHLNYKLITPKRLALFKAKNLFTLVYTINDITKAKELLAMGVNAICTDCIDIIKPTF
ncbi:glycerophosphodiester phosphodiesterase [Thorsellia anophelis]|uniref:Glycerophosphoryl diester phosphodiesterase n=1 Tax=Thorsellia anophelis DSM 18579 TaxID=1123402 RepID=A0A1I0AR03_9GAMM|nr:glycerophosphodiester phosphodiesterase [Thorsellia anophelis]SES96759.1 glycerophosphoryl diester phosphodiesterase [Thorsellia anophelis DSM 18579]